MDINGSILDRSGLVEAGLHHLQPIADKPRTYTYQPPEGVPERNFGTGARRVVIRDLRPHEDQPTLDREGFAVVRHRSAQRSFNDEAAVEGSY